MLGVLVPRLLMSAVVTQGGGGTSVNLSWDASADMNVVGYVVYVGGTSGSYSNRVDVGNVTETTITGLTPGTTNYFVVTSYDELGVESVPSNEASYITPGTLQARLESDGTLHLTFRVAAGHAYIVQSSDNTLTNWTTLTTIFAQTNGVYEFVDTNFTGAAKRYYRLILR